MVKYLRYVRPLYVRLASRLKPGIRVVLGIAACSGMLVSASTLGLCAQQTEAGPPVVVQPGAPGKPTRILPPTTKGTLPPAAAADVEFMQGMIMHHAQAVEMTALIESHTKNKDLALLGERISRSQSDEIRFMKRWLAARGQPVDMPGMDMSRADAAHGEISHENMSHGSIMLMP